MPLDPLLLTPAASLNRVSIEFDGSVQRTQAMDLLSAGALAALVAQRRQLFDIDVEEPRDAFKRFGESLPGLLAGRSTAAGDLLDIIAARLSRLIVTLQLAPQAARNARPEWDDSYWQHWRTIEKVWLGGGLMQAELGRQVAARAASHVRARGLSVRILASPFARDLALVGAARSSAVETGAVVLDFGHTTIKHALALYGSGTLDALHLLQPVPTASLGARVNPASDVSGLAENLADTIAGTWQDARALLGTEPGMTVHCAIASYVRNGSPYPGNPGLYGPLAALAHNLEQWLSDAVSRRLGSPVSVSLLHDGTAAGRAFAGSPNTAVIMLGTFLGSGFAPTAPDFIPLSPRFVVQEYGAESR